MEPVAVGQGVTVGLRATVVQVGDLGETSSAAEVMLGQVPQRVTVLDGHLPRRGGPGLCLCHRGRVVQTGGVGAPDGASSVATAVALGSAGGAVVAGVD